MEATYQLAYEDTNAIGELLPADRGLWNSRIMLLVRYCGPQTLLFCLAGAWYGLAAGWAVIVFMLIWFWWASRKLKKRMADRPDLWEATISIHSNFLEIRGSNGKSRRDWLDIERVEDHDEYVLMFRNDEQLIAAVPKRAFDELEKAHQFASLAAEFQRNAKSRGYPLYSPSLTEFIEPADPSAPDFTETKIGENATMDVTYRNTGSQLIDAQYGELVQESPGQKSGNSSTLGFVFFNAVLLFLSYQTLSLSSIWQSVVGGFTFLMMTITNLILSNQFQKRSALKKFNESELPELTVRISPAGIASISQYVSSFDSWVGIHELTRCTEVLAYSCENNMFAYLVRKDAFADIATLDRFVEVSNTYIEAAKEAAEIEQSKNSDGEPNNAPQRIETGNPYQAPSS